MIMRLLKMMAHEVTEANASSPSTNCTGMLASSTRRMIDRSCGMSGLLLRIQRVDEKIGQPLRPKGAGVDAGDAHLGARKQVTLLNLRTVDTLCERQGGGALGLRLA